MVKITITYEFMLIKSDVVNKVQNQKYVLNFNQRLSETLLLSKK